jgi:hypothetical protein
MKKKQPQCGGGCLGAPLRALSRACDSACDLYVRGMSGCAGHVPSGAAGAVGRGAYGMPAPASSMLLRASSDRAEDLVRAAARQSRRVAPVEVAAPGSNKVVPERKAGAAAMETIAEDAPCEFGAVNGACVLPPPSRRRRAPAAGLAARPGGFGAIKVGSEALTH